MFWALLCIHRCDCILCSGPSFAYTFATVSYALGFLLYADLGLCSVFFVYALQPYPGLWVLFCMHFRTVSDTPVFFCIRFLWPRPVLWVFCRMYFYDSILCSSSPFVFIFTTISYDMGLPLYASLRLYPMRCAFFCMHVYNCILCSGPSLVYILMVVSYALALFLFAFLRPYPMLRDFSCIYFCGLILYSWFSSAYICTTKSYTLGILFECISFVCIVTTVSYALGLPSYALLQPHPMLWTSFCIHSKDRILCPGSSCVCIFKNVSYALGLLLYAFL